MKIFLRIVFLAIAATMMFLISSWFGHKSTHIAKVSDFYSTPAEYDVLAFGPSYMYCTLITPELYRATGIRSFTPGTPCQSVDESFYFIKEALMRVKPKVILLGADMVVISEDKYVHSSSLAHEAVDGFPWGLSRLGMIANMKTNGDYDEFIVPFIKYHSRWKELGKNDFVLHTEHLDFNGSILYSTIGCSNGVKSYDLSTCARSDVYEGNLKLLEQLKELTQKHGVRFALVASPRSGCFADGRLAALHDYCEEHSIDFIDLLLDFDKTGIVNETDYYDSFHLNVFGAEKATRYIGKWLLDHYDFDNANVSAESRAWWDAEVERYDKTRDRALAREKAKQSASK